MDQTDVQQALLEQAQRQTDALEAMRHDVKNMNVVLMVFFMLVLLGSGVVGLVWAA